MHDLVIRNGLIVDGSGKKPFITLQMPDVEGKNMISSVASILSIKDFLNPGVFIF